MARCYAPPPPLLSGTVLQEGFANLPRSEKKARNLNTV